MSGFKEYQSRPVIRHAYQVKVDDAIDKVAGIESTYAITIAGERFLFKAYEDIKPGDYVVYLNDHDIYHCNAQVFAERNIIEGAES